MMNSADEDIGIFFEVLRVRFLFQAELSRINHLVGQIIMKRAFNFLMDVGVSYACRTKLSISQSADDMLVEVVHAPMCIVNCILCLLHYFY